MAVTALEIKSCSPFAPGQTFGDVGPYQQLDGAGGAGRRPVGRGAAGGGKGPVNFLYSDEPVGWIAMAPRTELARIETSRATPRVDNVDV